MICKSDPQDLFLRNRLDLANLKRHVKENIPCSARLNAIVLCLLHFHLSRQACANNPDHR